MAAADGKSYCEKVFWASLHHVTASDPVSGGSAPDRLPDCYLSGPELTRTFHWIYLQPAPPLHQPPADVTTLHPIPLVAAHQSSVKHDAIVTTVIQLLISSIVFLVLFWIKHTTLLICVASFFFTINDRFWSDSWFGFSWMGFEFYCQRMNIDYQNHMCTDMLILKTTKRRRNCSFCFFNFAKRE